MNEDLDRERVVSVSIVQRPDAPAQPAGPRHLPFALAGILIGLVGASGVLLYLLVFRETLITVESVERIIGLPVVASVPARPTGRS
jgi:capsular polysaccharide biosynthesis protein